MGGLRAGVVAVLAAVVGWGLGTGQSPAAESPAMSETAFPDCAAPPTETAPMAVSVGRVACQRLDAGSTLGAETVFSYYVPPACDPVAHPDRRCPVLYLLHGFGGTHTSEVGTTANPSAKVRALTSRPPVDPHEALDPWTYQDPAGWVPAPSIDLILVAPHGRTVPDGFGPVADLDSFWTDWNPKYAHGVAYDGPAPRFEEFLVDTLPEFVETHIPTAGEGREWRAVQGTSLGGYGSYLLALRRPDVYSSTGSVSGAHNFLFAPGAGPTPAASPVGLGAPADAGYLSVPGPVPANLPVASLPAEMRGFGVALLVLGDPALDQAYYRGHMPRDLAFNGRAWRGDTASLHIRGFVNDAVPRRAEDFANPQSYLVNQAFEAIVLEMNQTMEAAFTEHGVERTFHLNPGLHSGPYWNPFHRAQLEAQYDALAHWDDPGRSTPPKPDHFDYRTVDATFRIWQWRFTVDRGNGGPVEFLTLRDVSCDGLTLQGSGVVTVTVPGSCRTGVAGSRTFTVDLGPSLPVDEPAGASALPVHGSTVRVDLEPRR